MEILVWFPILFNRDKFLKLDATAYEALQIFQIDKHPSHMGIGRSKEGYISLICVKQILNYFSN